MISQPSGEAGANVRVSPANLRETEPVRADATATKGQLRQQLLDERRRRSEAARDQARLALADRVIALAGQRGWSSIAGYRPLRTEPGSVELLDRLRDAGLRVITPVLREDLDLDWTTEPEAGDRLGVEAIGGVEAVLVPALAVDRSGIRLGRGGGSYDRALARLPETVPTLALLFDGELLRRIPSDPWDRRVEYALLPSGAVRLELDAE
jgi:5-formyltetrahydrofolate cyclo-ligase